MKHLTRVIADPYADPKANVDWCQANGLDAAEIPAKGSLYIRGNTIHYRLFAKNEQGRRLIDPNGYDVLLTGWRETPLLVEPSQFHLGTALVKS